MPGRKDRPFQHLHSMSDPRHDKQFLIYPGVKLGKFRKILKPPAKPSETAREAP